MWRWKKPYGLALSAEIIRFIGEGQMFHVKFEVYCQMFLQAQLLMHDVMGLIHVRIDSHRGMWAT